MVVPGFARKKETGFLNRTVTMGAETYRYQVYVPTIWRNDKKWPIILFLHGAGERGEDGLIQTEVGIGTAIRRHSERFPFVVVFPQCRKDGWWTDDKMEAQAMKALDQSIKEFRGDPQAVYLTGISMGGYGTWSIAAKHPGKFAALVPVCGGIRRPRVSSAATEDPSAYVSTARKIGRTAVWIFHGAADPVVPVSESRKLAEALKQTNGNVKYTEYEGVGHNSWDKAYAEPSLFPWLLSQRLKSAH